MHRLAAPYPSNCWNIGPGEAKYRDVYAEMFPHVNYTQQVRKPYARPARNMRCTKVFTGLVNMWFI